MSACPPSFSFFAFLRIFTRSTMRLQPVLVRGGGDALRIDRLRVLAERDEQRRRGERVDQPRDPPAGRVNLPPPGGGAGGAPPPPAARGWRGRRIPPPRRRRPGGVAKADALPQR